MFNFKMNLRAGKFNQRIIDSRIKEILREAVKVYLREAYHYIRVDTGMSRGSLRPLASTLNIEIPISPKRTLPHKNISQGMDQSTHTDVTHQKSKFSFNWKTTVAQYYHNELAALPSNRFTPWNSMERGMTAAMRYLLGTSPQIAQAIKASWTKGKIYGE